MTSLNDDVPPPGEAQTMEDDAAVSKLLQLLLPDSGSAGSSPVRLQVRSNMYSPAYLRREARLIIDTASCISLIGERLALLDVAQELIARADQLES